MARRRFFRPNENYNTGPRINERIRLSPIFLIDENNQRVGEIETPEALRRAREAGLDLVEISPNNKPPVCKIMDFGKYKYEQSKKDRATKQKTKSSELKEVRMGRSMKIDPHDIEIRLAQARKFLLEGHKVQIVQNFMGREMLHKQRGWDRMKEITEKMDDISKLEVPPRMTGRRITMILAPDKVKIARYKQRMASHAAKPISAIEEGAASDPEQVSGTSDAQQPPTSDERPPDSSQELRDIVEASQS